MTFLGPLAGVIITKWSRAGLAFEGGPERRAGASKAGALKSRGTGVNLQFPRKDVGDGIGRCFDHFLKLVRARVAERNQAFEHLVERELFCHGFRSFEKENKADRQRLVSFRFARAFAGRRDWEFGRGLFLAGGPDIRDEGRGQGIVNIRGILPIIVFEGNLTGLI